MNRRHFGFDCNGFDLAASLDSAGGTTGLLIVSGGNEIRSGPWGSQAQLANTIANAGFPVMRFDRRGIGDSEGTNGTFLSSGPDIGAALDAFRAHVPSLRKIVAFGNCDAASALMLAKGTGCDGLVLSNPWTFDPHPEESAEAPPAAPPSVLRGYYLRRLLNPAAWKRLLSGKVRVSAMAASLAEAAGPSGPAGQLAQDMAMSLKDFAGPVTILLAGNDRTADAFRAVWDKSDPRIRTCVGSGHSFTEPHARIWLEGQIRAMLESV